MSFPRNNNNRNALRQGIAKRKKNPNRRVNAILDRGDEAHVAQNRIVRFIPAVYGFPDTLMTTLRYHEIGTLKSTLGVIAQYGYRWNSTFDPNFTGAGHQPLFRDTYAAIYNHYSVVTARCRITINNESAFSSFVSIVTDDDNTPSANTDTLAEMSHGFCTTLGPVSGSKSSVVFNPTWSCIKMLKIDPILDQTYHTAVGSNPSEDSIMWISNAGLGGNTTTIDYEVLFEYDVLWTELTTPTQS